MAARIVTVVCSLAFTLLSSFGTSLAIANPTQFFSTVRRCA